MIHFNKDTRENYYKQFGTRIVTSTEIHSSFYALPVHLNIPPSEFAYQGNGFVRFITFDVRIALASYIRQAFLGFLWVVFIQFHLHGARFANSSRISLRFRPYWKMKLLESARVVIFMFFLQPVSLWSRIFRNWHKSFN